MKRKPRVFIGPSQPWRETSWGSEFGGYLIVGGKACSIVQHLPKVVSLVPVARVGLVARGGSRVEESEPPGGDQGRGRDPPRLHEQDGSLPFQPNHSQPTRNRSGTPEIHTVSERARGYISSHTGRGLGENNLAVHP